MSTKPPSTKALFVEAQVNKTALPPDKAAISDDITTEVMLTKVRFIFASEIGRLSNSSKLGGLSKDESTALIAYSKELREWKKEEKAEADNMTEEELEAIANASR